MVARPTRRPHSAVRALHSVVAPEIAGEWLKALLDLSTFTDVTSSAVVLIARHTDDRLRDIDHGIREQAISRLTALEIAPKTIQLLSECVRRMGGCGPHLRGIAATWVASCQLFELLAIHPRVAQLCYEFFETGVNSGTIGNYVGQRNAKQSIFEPALLGSVRKRAASSGAYFPHLLSVTSPAR